MVGEYEKLEQRSKIILYLTKELQNLKERCPQITVDALKELLEFYPDASLLREAVLLFITRHLQGMQVDGSIKGILKLYEETDSMLNQAAELLNQIPEVVKTESELVSNIKNYTKEHYGDDNLNLQFIAEEVIHLGVKYIGKSFLKETGVRYSSYLLQVRMEAAKRMLCQPEKYSIEEIAERIGLGHNKPYFYQLFKQYTGITPGEYQKEIYV